MLYVLIWWLIIQLIALLALPITLKLLRFLPDRGVGFARQVGLLLAGYLFWLLVMLGVLQNTTPCIVAVLVGIGALSVAIWAREGPQMWALLGERKRLIMVTEGLFAVALAGFALFRAYNPEIVATEKPMEFAFINGILRSRTFPPKDPWLAGYAISYYYFGYVLAAMLTRLSGLPSDITFNLTGITLFALVTSGSFSLVYNLVQAAREHILQGGKASRLTGDTGSLWAGGLGALLVPLMGNLEGVLELIRARGLGSAAFWQWLDIKGMPPPTISSTWYPDDGWWWWRASRVIHDRDALGQSVEVIDEFPFFSFLLGDNHPHVLALPFVLLALALALNVLLSHSASSRRGDARGEAVGAVGLGARLRALLMDLWPGGAIDLLLWGPLLGSLGFLNTWDYPIYLGIFLLCYAAHRSRQRAALGDWLADTIALGVVLGILGIGLYLPFYLGFRSQAGGIGWVGIFKTRLHQYLLMMGVFIYCVASLLIALLLRLRRSQEGGGIPLAAWAAGGVFLLLTLFAAGQGWWTAALTLFLAGLAAALCLWGLWGRGDVERNGVLLSPSTVFVLLLIIVGLLLTGFVEFFFLKDTFGTRMNTVFKFYYQAWVLLAIASAYAIHDLLERLAHAAGALRAGLAVWSAGAIILILAGLSYTVAAIPSKAGGFGGQPTLDGTRYIAQHRPEDYGTVLWLREHAPEDAVMLEAPGGSYSEYNWISAHTGIPTLLGWGGHELQWRGSYDIPGQREPDIAAIYQGVDTVRTASLLAKYGIDYVYIGRLEKIKYNLAPPMIAKFDRILKRAYEGDGVTLYGALP